MLVKIVLVGDTGVGKSALIKAYLEDIFDDESYCTVLDVFRCKKIV